MALNIEIALSPPPPLPSLLQLFRKWKIGNHKVAHKIKMQ